jgi:hypothetical protein
MGPSTALSRESCVSLQHFYSTPTPTLLLVFFKKEETERVLRSFPVSSTEHTPGTEPRSGQLRRGCRMSRQFLANKTSIRYCLYGCAYACTVLYCDHGVALGHWPAVPSQLVDPRGSEPRSESGRDQPSGVHPSISRAGGRGGRARAVPVPVPPRIRGPRQLHIGWALLPFSPRDPRGRLLRSVPFHPSVPHPATPGIRGARGRPRHVLPLWLGLGAPARPRREVRWAPTRPRGDGPKAFTIHHQPPESREREDHRRARG